MRVDTTWKLFMQLQLIHFMSFSIRSVKVRVLFYFPSVNFSRYIVYRIKVCCSKICQIIILADSVYMSSHAGRNEFVLSEVGKVYAGTHNKIAGKHYSILL